MTGICGWIGHAGPAQPEVIAAMAAALVPSGKAAIETRSGAAACQAMAAQPAKVHSYSFEDALVAVSGCPRFEDRELADLAHRYGFARAFTEGYARRGSQVLAVVSGSFALALLDGGKGRALLAVDRLGVHPLFYDAVGNTLVFGSRLQAIDAFPGVHDGIDRQAIYDYVYFHMVPGPETVRGGRKRLMPGTLLHWDNGTAQVTPYWEMRFVEDVRRPQQELKEEFLGLLRTSVAAAAQHDAVGAFLSGGTDSSTIAGLLGEATGRPARTYSIGFEAQGYDEMHYARLAARHFRTEHHEYYVTPDDVVSAIPKIAAAHDQPFGNSSSVPAYYCAKLAKEDGVEVLLGGDGGDELFGGNARYAIQHLYSLYSDLPPAVRKVLIEPLAFALPSVSVIGKVQRYIRHASQEMPARYDNYNLVERLGADNIFTREFLSSVDTRQPQALMAEAYWHAKADTLINRMLAVDLRFTLADNDLPKVVQACELAGVAVRFPMLDDALVAFSANLEPSLKLKGTRLRYFFKQALREFLPAEILAKEKHGFGLPFGPWLLAHRPLREIAFDSLSALKARAIIRSDFIDELTSRHVQAHAHYFGTMVWVLMMLEQWFKKNTEQRAGLQQADGKVNRS